MPIGAIIGAVESIGGAVAGIGGALIGADASSSAAKTQANAANKATALQQQIWQQTQANEAPFVAAGSNSLAQLLAGLGVGGTGQGSLNKPFSWSDYTQSPGYQFEQQQGIDAIQNSASARGGVMGGNTLKALQQFGQGLATQDYTSQQSNYQSEQQRQIANLMSILGIGQSAASGQAAAGQNYANQAGANIMGAGNATAAGQVGSANQLAKGIGTAGSSLQQAFTSLYGPGNQTVYSSPYTVDTAAYTGQVVPGFQDPTQFNPFVMPQVG
jgi:hypothetical protein